MYNEQIFQEFIKEQKAQSLTAGVYNEDRMRTVPYVESDPIIARLNEMGVPNLKGTKWQVSKMLAGQTVLATYRIGHGKIVVADLTPSRSARSAMQYLLGLE